MREIIRRTKILMMLKRMPSKSLKKLKISTADYNRILKIVNEMTREEEFRKKVYDTGVKGKTGNSHLRFWKALKKFRSIIDELKWTNFTTILYIRASAMAGHSYINMVTMVFNMINKMLRGKMDRIVIIILSILPRSILFIMLNNKLSGFRISYLWGTEDIEYW